jgi:hypothetical protein
MQLTSFVGREEEIAEVTRLLDRTRLLTLSGPGGVGKTRLALAVAERMGGRFDAGVVFVPLAAVARPELVLGGIARAVGADLGGTSSPLEALAEQPAAAAGRLDPSTAGTPAMARRCWPGQPGDLVATTPPPPGVVSGPAPGPAGGPPAASCFGPLLRWGRAALDLAGVGRPGTIGVQVAAAVAGHSVAPVLPGVASHRPTGPQVVPPTPVWTVDSPGGQQHQRHEQPNTQPEDQRPHRDLLWPIPNGPSVAALVSSE